MERVRVRRDSRLSTQEFEQIRNILDGKMYGDAEALQQVVAGDVFCVDGWALAPTRSQLLDDIPGIGVMQYGPSSESSEFEWRLIDYRGTTFEACEKGPLKIKEKIGC
jgi:hypothetical protein